jgi:hypothetical protein
MLEANRSGTAPKTGRTTCSGGPPPGRVRTATCSMRVVGFGPASCYFVVGLKPSWDGAPAGPARPIATDAARNLISEASRRGTAPKAGRKAVQAPGQNPGPHRGRDFDPDSPPKILSGARGRPTKKTPGGGRGSPGVARKAGPGVRGCCWDSPSSDWALHIGSTRPL